MFYLRQKSAGEYVLSKTSTEDDLTEIVADTAEHASLLVNSWLIVSGVDLSGGYSLMAE
ncbi:hypothetical protein [Klebsiella michiganensis]|uniref:hypothetical protein n=1 Tax=Klebsiella michiganensis TaxID=1134687 RepID=UPI000AF274EE|nr:hypothetical protein [Klebsiella michiganensis]